MSQNLHQRGAKNVANPDKVGRVYPDFVGAGQRYMSIFRNEVGVNFGHLQRELKIQSHSSSKTSLNRFTA
jgi:hypothetical protein